MPVLVALPIRTPVETIAEFMADVQIYFPSEELVSSDTDLVQWRRSQNIPETGKMQSTQWRAWTKSTAENDPVYDTPKYSALVVLPSDDSGIIGKGNTDLVGAFIAKDIPVYVSIRSTIYPLSGIEVINTKDFIRHARLVPETK